jgi:hypothetical protein
MNIRPMPVRFSNQSGQAPLPMRDRIAAQVATPVVSTAINKNGLSLNYSNKNTANAAADFCYDFADAILRKQQSTPRFGNAQNTDTLSLRDRIAAQVAIPVAIATINKHGATYTDGRYDVSSATTAANYCYKFADEMLKNQQNAPRFGNTQPRNTQPDETLTLRDRIAAQIAAPMLSATINKSNSVYGTTVTNAAKHSYRFADAMLQLRGQTLGNYSVSSSITNN